MSTLNIFEWQIAGVDVYHILVWFFIYSFFGWIWESCYVSFKRKKWVNRGFVSGPFLTIYGFGAVSVFLLLKSLPKHVIVLYIGGVVVATMLEYVTAVVMEALFHMSWWDYSDNRFNFQGRICLGSSLCWGVMTLLLFYYFQPFVQMITNLISLRWGKIILIIVIILYTIDYTFSFITASNLSDKLHAINVVLEEGIGFVRESHLYDSNDEIKEKLYHLRHFVSNKKMEYMVDKREKEIIKRWDSLHQGENISEQRNSFVKKLHEYSSKFRLSKKTQNANIKRFMMAYPTLGRLSSKRKEKNGEEL